ncbi:MAG: hypothetical protein RJB27_632 [Actinomycetota bacterium]|jgi:hypothetical protein
MFEFDARNIIFALVAGLAAYAFGRRVLPWTLLGFIGTFWILLALMLSPKKPRTPLKEWNPFTELKRRPKE